MPERGMQHEGRKIIAEFWCDESLTLELRSVVVLAPYVFHDGQIGEGIDRYDVDLSKAYGYLFNLTGGGGRVPEPVSGIYWCSPGFPVKEEPTSYCSCNYEHGHIDAETRYIRLRNRTRRLTRLPKQFRNAEHLEWPVWPESGPAKVLHGDLMDWLEHNGIQEDAVYCSTCKDFFPGSELCEHCWWCITASYITPSEGSVCFDPDCYECCLVRRRKHEAYRTKKRHEKWLEKCPTQNVQQQEAQP